MLMPCELLLAFSRLLVGLPCGVATDFHSSFGDSETDRRYTVQRDSGEAFKVKPANVRAEGTGDGAGAGKAKGEGKKGKKGRGGRS